MSYINGGSGGIIFLKSNVKRSITLKMSTTITLEMASKLMTLRERVEYGSYRCTCSYKACLRDFVRSVA